MSFQELLGGALTFLFNLFDCIILLLFFTVFGHRRWQGARLWLAVAAGWAANVLFHLDGGFTRSGFALKAAFEFGLYAAAGWMFCAGLSLLQTGLLAAFWYLGSYLRSYGMVQAAALFCGLTPAQLQTWEHRVPYIVSALIYYAAEMGLVLAFRRLYPRRRQLRLRPGQAALYLAFPAASLGALAVFVRVGGGLAVSGGLVLGCTAALLLANGAVFCLLDQTERAARDREKLRALDQQMQTQSAGLASARALYEGQRRQVHDFRAHLEVLRQMLDRQQYDAARAYLQAAAQQTGQDVLVCCGHPALDALFNTKAAAAAEKKIDIRFTVSDLSALPFDPADLTVLLANLLDNAIEACERCEGERCIEVGAVGQGEGLLFSVRNTSRPVELAGDAAPATTKPDPALHGFGLDNVKAILKKYGGDFAMQYAAGWFEFVGEVPARPAP